MAQFAVQATTSQAAQPPDWVHLGQVVWDGDFISLRNEAWKKDGGTILTHSESVGLVTANIDAEKSGNESLYVSGRIAHPAKMGNKYTWMIRKCRYDAAKMNWIIDNFDMNNRTQILLGDRFMLHEAMGPLSSEAAPWVMGTDAPAHLAFVDNGNYRVKRMPMIMNTNTGMCSMGATRNNSDCKDHLDVAACVWYFASVSGLTSTTSAVNYGNMKYLLRNEWTHHAVQFGRGFNSAADGRNLTQADGQFHTVKLAEANNNSVDRSQWYVESWAGYWYPVARHLDAAPLEPCRPGNFRESITGACKDPPVPCAPGQYFGQDGKCQTGVCNGTRTPNGYCNIPSAPPTTPSGDYNVFYDKNSHDAYLASLAESERQRLAAEAAARVPPTGTVYNHQTGQYDQVAVGVLDTDKTHYGECGPGQIKNSRTGACYLPVHAPDTRGWFDQHVYYPLTGHNWEEAAWYEQGLVIGGPALAGVAFLGGTGYFVSKEVGRRLGSIGEHMQM